MHHVKGQQRNQLQMICLDQVVAQDSFKVLGQNSLKNNYNATNDTYTCPAGETLSTNGTWHAHSTKGKTAAFRFQRYSTKACKGCAKREKCTKGKVNGRNIDRSEFATLIEQNNQRVNAYPDYYRQRQQLAEHPWGTIKRQRGFDHVLTRGKANVLGEVSLVFIGYNLGRCARILKSHDAFKVLLDRHIALFLHQNRPILSPFGLLCWQNQKLVA